MKSFKLLVVFVAFGIVSCEYEVGKIANYYQNYSEGLERWWRKINGEDNDYPIYYHFSDYITTTHTYSIYNNS
ncbi:hypothetical protein [Flavobacterium sp. JP2137]|uniref:hypothetical protein n=1 Tax=Flavobacterium sp. JP2137 TaxID=3414510 RepID=UPI003D2FCAEF